MPLHPVHTGLRVTGTTHRMPSFQTECVLHQQVLIWWITASLHQRVALSGDVSQLCLESPPLQPWTKALHPVNKGSRVWISCGQLTKSRPTSKQPWYHQSVLQNTTTDPLDRFFSQAAEICKSHGASVISCGKYSCVQRTCQRDLIIFLATPLDHPANIGQFRSPSHC